MNETVPKPLIVIVTLACLVVILAGMKAAESIITPLLLALFIAAISSPGYFWLLRKKVPVVIALLVVILAVFLVGTVMSALVRGALSGFTENLPFYQQRLTDVWVEFLALLQRYNIPIDYAQLTAESADIPALMGFVGNTLNNLIGIFTGAFFILLALGFVLAELSVVHKKVRAISTDSEQSIARLEYFFNTLNQYFAMKTLISFVTGLIVYGWLKIFGVDYPVLWALVAFLLNFVPTIGSLIAAAPAVLMTIIQFGVGTSLWVALGYLVINNLIGGVVEPRVMGQRLGLSVLVVFLSLVIWGWLLGPVGMFLSVPLTMTAKIALESSPSSAWIGVLLGNGSGLKK